MIIKFRFTETDFARKCSGPLLKSLETHSNVTHPFTFTIYVVTATQRGQTRKCLTSSQKPLIKFAFAFSLYFNVLFGLKIHGYCAQRRSYRSDSLTENFNDGNWWYAKVSCLVLTCGHWRLEGAQSQLFTSVNRLHATDLVLLVNQIKRKIVLHEARRKENRPFDPKSISFCAFGYSMGGTAVAMAQLLVPGLFKTALLFEPIILPKSAAPTPLAAASAARRSEFPSREAAREQFLRKESSMYRKWDSRALDAYLTHGMKNGANNSVVLKCPPAVEGATFRDGDLNGLWEMLDLFSTNYTVLMIGSASLHFPSILAEPLRARLPHHHFVRIDGGDHFVPMTNPKETAQIVTGILARAPPSPSSKL